MLSHDTTPRFRNLSIHSTPRFVSSSFSTNEKDHEERRDPEKECFMCRQANVYMKPIGMQQERRVARRHPPPLTRAQIDELSQKKKLTKREARLLLQCYFPEIKNVKYFQLHKYHSCCYDPKHLNLCKNHITALQHEREKYPNQHFYPHDHDDHHYTSNDGQQNRVSFVRIKIEPTKGIPTRFLGPTALPESLADMLIKQVNRYEDKKRPLSFNSDPPNTVQTYKVRRLDEVPYGTDVSRLSEHLANLDSDDDDDDEEDDDNNNDDGNDSSDGENQQDGYLLNTPNSNIRGYQGKVMDRSRLKYERKLQTRQEKDKDKEDLSTNVTNGDLVVEDIDEINHLFVNEQGLKLPKLSKNKKRKKRSKKHSQSHHHHHPKLNHWEQMALDQSKQEVCGCRHHVKRLEADQIIYDWCRCKDHSHKDLKQRRKSIPPPPPPPPPPPRPKKLKKVTPPPKIEKKTIGINATEKTTTELALAYDPTTVDYDIIQEVLYYRTSSGRLVKPEITNAFSYNDKSPTKGLNQNKSFLKKSAVLPILEVDEKTQPRETPNFSKRGSVANGYTLVDTDVLPIKNGTGGTMPSYEVRNSLSTTTGVGEMYGNDDNDDDNDDDDDDQDDTVDFTPPKYLPEMPVVSPVQSPSVPMSMQKSSKPTYVNQRPTPNFERESSLLANRRWFDQALGDQNLLPVHDGRYGLIAGTSAEEYKLQSQFPDNEYVEPLSQRRNKSNCTIS